MKLTDFKPEGVPIFVTAYAAVLAIIGIFLGISALIDPTTAVGYVAGDVVGALNSGSSEIVMVLLVFLALDLVWLFFSARALRPGKVS